MWRRFRRLFVSLVIAGTLVGGLAPPRPAKALSDSEIAVVAGVAAAGYILIVIVATWMIHREKYSALADPPAVLDRQPEPDGLRVIGCTTETGAPALACW